MSVGVADVDLHPYHDRVQHFAHEFEIGKQQCSFGGGDVAFLVQRRPVQPPTSGGGQLAQERTQGAPVAFTERMPGVELAILLSQ